MTNFPVFLLLVLSLTVLACGEQAPEKQATSTAFGVGTTLPGHYRNDYFNLDIFFDSTWTVEQKSPSVQIEWVEGVEAPLAKNGDWIWGLDPSKVASVFLLQVSKHPTSYKADYNPSFIALAENLQLYPKLQTVEAYLLDVRTMLQETELDYTFGDIQQKRVDKKVFHILPAQAIYQGAEVKQVYWALAERDFCLTFITSFQTDQQEAELEAILQRVCLSS